MLKQLLNTLTGSFAQASFSAPQANGINVPRSAVVKNFFGNVFSSLSASQGFGISQNGSPSYGGGFGGPGVGPGFGTPTSTINSFRNLQGVGKRGKALAPGSFVNSFPSEPSQNPRQQVAGGPFFGPSQFGGAPLQGFAGQAGFGGTPGGFSPQLNAPTGFPGTGFVPPQTGSQGGFLPLLIMPFVGLITVISSLFKVKKLVNSFKPVEVSTDTSYDQYKSHLDEIYASRGSFDVEDEFDPEGVDYTGPDISGIQDF